MIGVAFDIDGTLTDASGMVLPRVKDSLHRCWCKAVFMLVSARPVSGVEFILEQIGREGPYVALNGGVTALGVRKPPLAIAYLPPAAPRAVFQTAGMRHGLIRAVFRFAQRTWAAWGDARAIEEEARLNAMSVNAVRSVEEFGTDRPVKLTVVCRDSSAWDTVFHELAVSPMPWQVRKSRPYYIEAVSGDTSKEQALARLLGVLGISRLIAVGDGENDIGMFRMAARSYAVPSALPTVQNAASCVLPKPVDLALSRLVESIGAGETIADEVGKGGDNGSWPRSPGDRPAE